MPDPTGRISHLPEFHRGVSWKQPCRVATTANVTISTDLNAGDTIDGITLAAGDRVLVKDQTTEANNGIYVAGATPTRDYDMDQDASTSVPASEVTGAVVYVIDGTVNGGTIWRNTNTTAPLLGINAITFAEISSSGGSGGSGGSLTYERFVALGDTPETFTLAASPASVLAIVDGVIQDPDEVGLTGADVDVNTAVDDIVVIVYGGGSGGGSGSGLLEEHTASTSATLDFTTFISSTYDEYLFEFVNVMPASDDVQFLMRMGTGGGPTFDTGTNYGWAIYLWRAGASVSAGAEGGATAIGLSYAGGGTVGVSNSANWGGIRGHIRLFDPESSIYKQIDGQTHYLDAEPFRLGSVVRGSYESTTVVTAVQFLFASGNIASGTIRVYGVARS